MVSGVKFQTDFVYTGATGTTSPESLCTFLMCPCIVLYQGSDLKFKRMYHITNECVCACVIVGKREHWLSVKLSIMMLP